MKYSKKIGILIVGIVAVAIWSLLLWNYTHGGVPSHHILNKKDLPEISNWWGGLLLPFFTWFMVLCIERREKLMVPQNSFLPSRVLYGFIGALAYGILLALLFTFDYSQILDYFFPSIIVLSLFYPIYRAECLLGFVIGMTFTFGAILPMGIGSILALIGYITYQIVQFVQRIILKKANKGRR